MTDYTNIVAPKNPFEGQIWHKNNGILTKSYILMNGLWEFHNLNGPAISFHLKNVWPNEDEYWIKGKLLRKEEFLVRTSKLGRILYG